MPWVLVHHWQAFCAERENANKRAGDERTGRSPPTGERTMGRNCLRLAAGPVLAATLAATLAPTPAAAQTAAAPPVAATPTGVGSAFELTFWQSVTGSEDAASYEAYLARYPDGTFAGLARARIAAIQRAMAVQPAAAPHPTPAVLTMPQAAKPLAPAPAAAASAPAAPAAEILPAAAPVTVAAAAPSPLARLLAQLRGSGDTGASQSEALPMVTAAPPVQPLPAPGLASPAPIQPSSAPAAALTPAATPAMAPAMTPATTYASGRPLLLPVPQVLLPAYFCSNDARNEFHNTAYRPAVEAATRNNEAAVAYLRQLQQTYDRGQLGRDTAVLSAISTEARAYQSEAAYAYAVEAALVRQFDALMAVPLRTCAPATQ